MERHVREKGSNGNMQQTKGECSYMIIVKQFLKVNDGIRMAYSTGYIWRIVLLFYIKILIYYILCNYLQC